MAENQAEEVQDAPTGLFSGITITASAYVVRDGQIVEE